MTINRKSALLDFFGRKKSTYGLVLPEEFQVASANMQNKTRRRSSRGIKDCFVPSELDRWELPQYDSLFNQLVMQDGQFRRRLSSTASNISYSKTREEDESAADNPQGENDGSTGPLKAVQKWFKEIVKSITHHSEDYDLGGDVAVEGIPVDMCEKLRYVHIYL